MSRNRVTLQTIADRLGVSRTTVSNAYNRPDQLAPELRRKVLDTAAQLGYAGPDAAARRLRSGGAEAIGLLFHGLARLRVHRSRRRAVHPGLRAGDRGGGAGDPDARRARSTGSRGHRTPSTRRSSRGSACTRCRSDRPTSTRRSRARSRWCSWTSRARAPTRSSGSTTRRARAWPPSTCSSSGTAASASSPSAPSTTTTTARSTPDREAAAHLSRHVGAPRGWREPLEAAGVGPEDHPREERSSNTARGRRGRPAGPAGARAAPDRGRSSPATSWRSAGSGPRATPAAARPLDRRLRRHPGPRRLAGLTTVAQPLRGEGRDRRPPALERDTEPPREVILPARARRPRDRRAPPA